jgi:hypothetical protein
MGLDQGIPVKETGVLPMKNLGAKIAADLVIQHIPKDSGCGKHAHQHKDIHTTLTNCRQCTSHKKQGVTGQERRHDKPGFRKNNHEKDAVNPQPVLLHHDRQMFVEMKNNIDELRKVFHA